MNYSRGFSQNGTNPLTGGDFTVDQESVYIGVGVGAGLLFSLALFGLVAAVACLGQRRTGGARSARLTSTVSLARSDFDSYKSGSHYYVSSSDHIDEIMRDEVRQVRKQTRAVPSWPIEHALPASPTASVHVVRTTETISDFEDVDDVVISETKARKYRSRSSSWGRKRKEDNAHRRSEVRRVSESSIRLPEVKSIFGGPGMTSSSPESHSLATLSLNFHKPHVRMAELEKYREAEIESAGTR
ncbi:hypothetical protein RRG08_035613 [Elysia crispata]|uniref:Uncharacterized protein n=1 Tax=Elysia crispata TaxID=231223 RepID=A0AAE1B5Z4_9GAST|nr:hypothetical protein RRG08_035613 [Elysia crispata]